MSWIYSEGLSFLKREGGLYTKVCNQDQRILFKKKKINHVWLCSSKLFLVIAVQALIRIATLSYFWSILATRTTSNSSCSVAFHRGGFPLIALATQRPQCPCHWKHFFSFSLCSLFLWIKHTNGIYLKDGHFTQLVCLLAPRLPVFHLNLPCNAIWLWGFTAALPRFLGGSEKTSTDNGRGGHRSHDLGGTGFRGRAGSINVCADLWPSLDCGDSSSISMHIL